MNYKSLLFPVFLLTMAGTASGQEALDEVTVSGNKEGRTLSETPESVTILPPSRINRGDQQNSLEVLNGQANVQVSRNAEVFSIRGINNTGTTGFQRDNLSSIFNDDVWQSDLALRAGAFEVWDMQALEVYRGPQSTTQGVNSLAGAVILQHMEPHQEKETALKLGYGSFDRRELGAVINRAILDRKLAIRISFNKDANDGFLKNKTTNNDSWGRQNKDHLVGDFKYFFEDGSSLRFNNKFMRTENGGTYSIGGNPFKFEVREDEDARSITSNQQNSLTYSRPLSKQLSSRTTLAYTKGIQSNKSDADGTPLPTLGTRREHLTDQFMSVESVLKYTSSKIKNALGVHAHQYKANSSYDFSLLYPPSTPVPVINDVFKTRETYALFDSLLYQLDDHHGLNLGARYEFVHNVYGTSVDALPSGNATADAYISARRGSYEGSQNTNMFLPKIGYIYQNKQDTWGLTYSEGYRIGGVDINRSRAQAVKYDPEKTDNFELSWKRISDRLQTQANIFYTSWKDQQVEVRLTPNDFYDSQVQNGSKSELYGGEVESTYKLKNGNLIRAGVGHVRTRFLGGFQGNGNSYIGNEFPDAARWTAQTAYSHHFTDKINSNLTLRHVGRSYSNAENTRRVPEQFYVDLNLQYVGAGFIWELNGRNLLGKEYVLNSTSIYQNTYSRMSRPRELNTRVTFFW